MKEFHAQVCALTLQAQQRASIFYSPNDLIIPDANGIFGAEAGTDYADHIIKTLKDFILLEAECKRTNVTFLPPTMGPGARAGFLDRLAVHLASFEVRWEHHTLTIYWQCSDKP